MWNELEPLRWLMGIACAILIVAVIYTISVVYEQNVYGEAYCAERNMQYKRMKALQYCKDDLGTMYKIPSLKELKNGN